MFIVTETAKAIVNEMKSVTGQAIYLMDGCGIIVAGTDPGRVGQRHMGAEHLTAGGGGPASSLER